MKGILDSLAKIFMGNGIIKNSNSYIRVIHASGYWYVRNNHNNGHSVCNR